MSALPPALDDRDGKIWMDGELVDWRDAKIHVCLLYTSPSPRDS